MGREAGDSLEGPQEVKRAQAGLVGEAVKRQRPIQIAFDDANRPGHSFAGAR